MDKGHSRIHWIH